MALIVSQGGGRLPSPAPATCINPVNRQATLGLPIPNILTLCPFYHHTKPFLLSSPSARLHPSLRVLLSLVLGDTLTWVIEVLSKVLVQSDQAAGRK